jgi:hypothetical protein
LLGARLIAAQASTAQIFRPQAFVAWTDSSIRSLRKLILWLMQSIEWIAASVLHRSLVAL